MYRALTASLDNYRIIASFNGVYVKAFVMVDYTEVLCKWNLGEVLKNFYIEVDFVQFCFINPFIDRTNVQLQKLTCN